jgi:uncharacterized protein YeaO (DUF488 family)
VAEGRGASTELRKWYGHAPNRFDEFSRRYRKELTKESTRDALRQLRELTSAEEVVLVTATKDLERSAAAVLRDLLSGI